jgi:epoxyqueuosine reductase
LKKEIQALQQHLTNRGFKSAIVSIRHLPELRDELEQLLESGLLNRDFYDETVSRLGLYWDFKPPADLPRAESIILVAVPVLKVRVPVTVSGQTSCVIIPPNYLNSTDKKMKGILSHYSQSYGLSFVKAILPEKLLAVRSGLARYGRNNIAYIDGWGSYFRLRTFFSDVPYPPDHWREMKMMEICDSCSACRKMCPTEAICEGRFLIRCERCLTFYNEGPEEFPEWIDSAWHNCLIGCMICQDVCPANKNFTDWINEGEAFTEEETMMIWDGMPIDKLPHVMVEKLRTLCVIDDYALLQRNLRVLLNG